MFATTACQTCTRAMRQAGRGLRGLAKAVVGVDRAPARLAHRRREICRRCPSATPCLTEPDEACWCGRPLIASERPEPTCGCSLAAKTRVGSESCPQGKW